MTPAINNISTPNQSTTKTDHAIQRTTIAKPPSTPTLQAQAQLYLQSYNKNEDLKGANVGSEEHRIGMINLLMTIIDAEWPSQWFKRFGDDVADQLIPLMAGKKYDPWPGLDKAHLMFLIGGRAGTSKRHYEFSFIARYNSDRPLTLREKVIAASEREWLEAGLTQKKKMLADAQATILRLTGKVV